MNDEHLRLCASAEWAALVRDDLRPWVLGDDELSDHVLELGAGPGLVTDLLIERAPRVTAVEIDESLAAALRVRMAGRPVEVVTADATALPLPDGRFASVACFTTLHHIPGRGLQDRVLTQIARVLRPGGLLLGTDGEDTLLTEPFTSVTFSSRSIRRGSPIGFGQPGSSTRPSTATAIPSVSAPGPASSCALVGDTSVDADGAVHAWLDQQDTTPPTTAHLSRSARVAFTNRVRTE